MSITRRRVLQGASGIVAAALPASTSARAAEQSDAKTTVTETRASGDVTGRLARYMVAARDRELPAPILRDAKNRILDTIGAMISGAVLPPGVMATRYVRAQGGTADGLTKVFGAAVRNVVPSSSREILGAGPSGLQDAADRANDAYRTVLGY